LDLGIPFKAPAGAAKGAHRSDGLTDSHRPPAMTLATPLPVARFAACACRRCNIFAVAGIASSARGVAVWQIHINRQRY